jgi:ABC-2 type transport system permease protein
MVAALIQIIVAPLIPLSLSLVVLHLFVRGKKHARKNRESWAILFMLVLLVVLQGLASRWMQSGMDSSSMENFAKSFGVLLQGLQRVLLFPKWQMFMAIGDYTIRNGLYFLLAVSGITIGAIFLVATAYGETVTRLWETSTTARRNNRTSGRSYSGRYAVEWALVRREFSIINEHSAFKMELYGEAVIPLILVIVYAISGVMGEFKVMLQPVLELNSFPLMVAGALLLTASLSMMSGTSYSREGKLLALSRTMPLEGEVFVRGKIAAHLMMFYSSYLVFSLAALMIFKLELSNVIWIMPLGFFVVGSSACFGLAIDSRNPRLDWQLPQQAVKQNLNGVVGMGISFGNIAVLAGLGYLLTQQLGLSVLPSGLLLVVPSACIWILSWKLAVSGARRLYQGR